MKHAFASFAVISLCLAGCESSHQPEIRGVPIEAGSADSGDSKADQSMTMPPGHGQLPPGHGQLPPGHPQPAAAIATGPEVDLGPGKLTAPEGWQRKQPRVGFILAEFTLPKAEGDAADGRLTVTSAGGGIKENVDRWRGQFTGKPEKDSEKKIKVDDVDVTLVDFSGTFQESHGMMGPTEDRPNYRMIGAIIELEEKLYFIKAYGPDKTMAGNEKKFDEFVQSLKKK